MTTSEITYIDIGVRIPGSVSLYNLFNLVLGLRCLSSTDEVVAVLEESILSSVQWAITKYPVLNTLVVAF